MNCIQIKSNRTAPLIMSLAGVFIICVGLYTFKVRGIIPMYVFNIIIGAACFYFAHIEKKNKNFYHE